MKTDRTSFLDLAEKLEVAGDVAGVRTCLDLAAKADPTIREDARFKAIDDKLSTFIDRRRLLRVGSGFVATLLASAAGFGGLLYLIPPKRRLSSEPVVKLGPAEKFDKDSFRLAEYRGHPILVIRDAMGDFYALSAICTHSEVCLLGWQAETQEIVCPCHRAAFDLRGNVIEGPPPKPLAAYPVLVQNGTVFVKIG